MRHELGEAHDTLTIGRAFGRLLGLGSVGRRGAGDWRGAFCPCGGKLGVVEQQRRQGLPQNATRRDRRACTGRHGRALAARSNDGLAGFRDRWSSGCGRRVRYPIHNTSDNLTGLERVPRVGIEALRALAVLSVLAPLSSASFRHRGWHSSCYQDSEDNRGFPHIPPAPYCGGNMLAHCGSAP